MPPETPPSRLEEIRARCEAASPGPWRGDRYDGSVKYVLMDRDGEAVIRGDNGNADGGPFGILGDADEVFVLRARDDVPYLLALLDQLLAARDRARREALEEAARVCLSMAHDARLTANGANYYGDTAAWNLASARLNEASAAIRALQKLPSPTPPGSA